MAISQNLIFEGSCESNSEFEHPKGYSLAQLLAQRIGMNSWQSQDPEGWRGVGWSIRCSLAQKDIEVVLSEFQDNQWMLQIAPSTVPQLGFWARLFGKQLNETPSAEPEDCLSIANLVHEILLDNGYTTKGWCWDGFPDESNSTESPSAATIS